MAPSKTVYRCGQCGKHISRKTDLNRHMNLHAPNKAALMIPCPYPDCNYKTLQHSNLKTHIYTHTGERPYKCPHEGCGFDTRDPGALTRHRRKNHGYVPKNNIRNRTKSSTGARRTPPREARSMPYDTSLRPSRNTEVPSQPPVCNPCLISSGVGEEAHVLKNNILAFETELAQTFARANSLTVDTSPDTQGSSPSSSFPLTAPELQIAADMSLFDWQGLFTSDQFDTQTPQLTRQPDRELDRFLVNYNQYMANAPLAHDPILNPNPNMVIPTAKSMSPLESQDPFTLNKFNEQIPQSTPQSEDELDRFLQNYDKHIAKASLAYNTISGPDFDMAIPTAPRASTVDAIDDTALLSPMSLPPSNAQVQLYQYDTIKVHNTDHAYYGQPTTRHAGHPPLNSYRVAFTDSVHPQTMPSEFYDDPTCPYTAPVDPSALQGVENFFAF